MQSIIDTVRIDTIIDLDTNIKIVNQADVNLVMKLHDSFSVVLTVPLDTSLSVPFSVPVKDTLKNIESILALPEPLNLSISGLIPVDKNFALPNIFELRPKIKGVILLKNNPIIATLDSSTKFRTSIPVDMKVHGIISVPLKLHININQNLKASGEIKDSAHVSFLNPIHIVGKVRLHLAIPVRINLFANPIKKIF